MKMKKNWPTVIFCLSAIMMPISTHCKTEAFSPSIPGQPLIFHTTIPSVSKLDRKIFEKLSNSQVHKLYELSKLGILLSEEVLGLVGTIFLPTSLAQKESVALIYDNDMASVIDQINQLFLSLEGDSSQQLANLVKHTLDSFIQITNEMLRNTAIVPNNTAYQQNYMQMQVEVINAFKAGLDELFDDSETNAILKAEAGSALEALVSCLSLYILNTQSLVNGNSGSKNLVLARQQILKNMAIFVETTFVLQALTSNQCG